MRTIRYTICDVNGKIVQFNAATIIAWAVISLAMAIFLVWCVAL